MSESATGGSWASLDPADMLGAVRAFPSHFREGWVQAADLEPRHRATDLDGMVIVGMGGSAIAGDLLRGYAYASSPVPVEVVRDYTLPRWVGPNTLVLASSYSGNTEETLAAAAEAEERGAAVYVVASGGALMEDAQHRGMPHVRLPTGMQPRAALGYSFAALLRVADKLGLIDVHEDAFTEAVDSARAQSTAMGKDSGGEALDLAKSLYGRLSVIYTGSGILEPVGRRWQTQLHENAKQLAYGNRYAELNHNEVVGWEETPSALRERVAVVVLRDPEDHPRIRQRMDATRRILQERAASWTEIDARGRHRLTRMLTTIQLGDFTSCYLAMLLGVDPTPVATIDRIKAELAGD
jgi:glucose/mannose-6-phosphate isomerase